MDRMAARVTVVRIGRRDVASRARVCGDVMVGDRTDVGRMPRIADVLHCVSGRRIDMDRMAARVTVVRIGRRNVTSRARVCGDIWRRIIDVRRAQVMRNANLIELVQMLNYCEVSFLLMYRE